jgi:hypothetical protein
MNIKTSRGKNLEKNVLIFQMREHVSTLVQKLLFEFSVSMTARRSRAISHRTSEGKKTERHFWIQPV